MLAFSVRSDRFAKIERRPSKTGEGVNVAVRLLFCCVLLCLTYVLVERLLALTATTSVHAKAAPDPFLVTSKTSLAKLRGTAAYIHLTDPIRTGSTLVDDVGDDVRVGETGNRRVLNLHDRPSNGFKFRHPEELVNPDLHIR